MNEHTKQQAAMIAAFLLAMIGMAMILLSDKQWASAFGMGCVFLGGYAAGLLAADMSS
jgi:hypothetical protein